MYSDTQKLVRRLLRTKMSDQARAEACIPLPEGVTCYEGMLMVNERQRRFAEAYAADPNATRAAIAAGYSERTARSQGQRLLTKVYIQAYLQQLQDAARTERIATADEVRQYWTAVLRDREQKTEHRIKAGELLMKSGGEMVQRVEVSADVDVEEENDVIIFLPDNGRPVITDDIIAELYPDADPEKKMNERRKQNV